MSVAPRTYDRFVLTMFGQDKPGIVYHVASYLASGGVNITDLYGRTSEGEFTMVLELEAPTELDPRKLKFDLEELGRSFGLSAHFQHENLFLAIFDGKDFTKMGPVGCNMCAGVISETLLNRLAEQGLGLPEERVQRKIQGYYFQTEANTIRLNHPEGAEKITTVFRGNGPRFSVHNGNISFDDFLLQHVKSQGVSVIQALVQKLILPSNPTLPASLSYGRTNSWDSLREIGTASISRGEFKADLVVGAFGLNTTMLSKVEELGFGYIPPRGVKACQADIAFPSALIDERLQNRIVAINLNIGDVRVATITPKASHITISQIHSLEYADGQYPIPKYLL